jgi:hypothetical protein
MWLASQGSPFCATYTERRDWTVELNSTAFCGLHSLKKRPTVHDETSDCVETLQNAQQRAKFNCLACWIISWLICRSVCLSADWLSNWLVCLLFAPRRRWTIGSWVNWPLHWLIAQSVWLFSWSVDWLVNWLRAYISGQSVHWLICYFWMFICCFRRLTGKFLCYFLGWYVVGCPLSWLNDVSETTHGTAVKLNGICVQRRFKGNVYSCILKLNVGELATVHITRYRAHRLGRLQQTAHFIQSHLLR